MPMPSKSPKMMKAFQLTAYGQPLELCDIEIPTPVGHEVLARTTVSGVCHTDVHVINADCGETALPLTPGHEGVGIVTAVGSEVTLFKVGDRIGVAWLGSSCMKCNLCNEGKENICLAQTQTGFSRNGSFAEYFISDERFAAKIPAGIKDAEAAPVLCAGVTAYKALRMSGVRKGSRVVISGASGGLGHMGVQYAKLLGCEVVAVCLQGASNDGLLKKIGADHIVTIGKESATLMDQFNALPVKPVDAAVIFAPSIQAVSDAINYVSPGGCIVAVALPAGNYNFPVKDFIFKELSLKGSIVGTPRDLATAFELAAAGHVTAHVMEKPFSAANDVLKDLVAGRIQGRVVLRISEE